MKKNLLSAFLICLSFISFSQFISYPPERYVGWTASGSFNAIQKTPDGGVIGFANNQTSKYSESGTLEFTLPFSPKTLIPTSDGGYIMGVNANAAQTSLTNYFGGSDTWIVKINALGVIQWQHSLSGTGDDNLESMKLNSNGDLIVLINSNSTTDFGVGNQGGKDLWLVHLSSIGTLTKINLGGSADETFKNLETVSSTESLVCLTTTSQNGVFNQGFKGGIDTWVLKITKGISLSITQKRAYGGYGDDEGSLAISNAKYLISGYSKSSNGDLSVNKGLKDLWICFINPDGTLISSDNYGGTGDDLVRDAYYNTADNAFYILGDCGSADGDFPNSSSGIVNDRLFKFSSTGVFDWRRDFYVSRPFGVACSLIKLPNESGNFISGRITNSYSTNLFNASVASAYGSSTFFCKLNSSDGSTQWFKQPSYGRNSASISLLQKLADGNILCTTNSQASTSGLSKIFTINSQGIEVKTDFKYNSCPIYTGQNTPTCIPPLLSATSGANGVTYVNYEGVIRKVCPQVYEGISRQYKLYCNTTISDTIQVPNDNEFTYQWKRNGSVIGGATSPKYLATQTGKYTVEISGKTCAGKAETDTIVLALATYQTIIPQLKVLTDSDVCVGDTVKMNLSDGCNYNYLQWQKDGLDISGETSLNYKTTLVGVYRVKVTTNGVVSYTNTKTVTYKINNCLNYPGISLNLPNSTLFEGQESIQLTVSLSKPSSQNISANLNFSGTAILGTDYTVDKQTVNFLPGNTLETVTISAINDNLVEILENIQIQVSGGSYISTPYPSITTYLSSEDKPAASLSLDKTSINETGGVATLTATLSAPTSQAVTIALKPSGSAIDRVDYDASFTGKDEATTVAGGSSTYNQLSSPSGVFVDNIGNVFVADQSNHRIQKWTPGATQGITVAGGNGSGSAANQLSSPYGVFVDGNENIFIADAGNHRIQKWPSGATQGITVAGGNGEGSAANQLYFPTGVYVDRNGNIFVADQNNHRIQKWTAGATQGTTVAGGNGSGSAANQFNYSTGVYVDSNGNIFVADANNQRIQKWPPGATQGITVAGGNGFGSAANQLSIPQSVYVDSDGNVFVADWLNHRVQKWTPGATQGITVAGGNGQGFAANQLNYISSVFVDSNGNIFVAEAGNNRVQKWTSGATKGITVAGGNYPSAASQLSYPSGVYVDSNGNVFIADQYNNRIQKWTFGSTQGITVAGGNGYGSAANQLSSTTGVCVDNNGNIFVADLFNNRIQKWASGATQGITVAGGNGFGSAANQLNGPQGVYVDGNGNIFVADGDNHRVQKWTPGATQGVTVAGGNGDGSAANQLSNPRGVHADINGNIFVADASNHRIQKWTPNATQGTTVAGGNGYGSAANQLYGPHGVFVDNNGNIYIADGSNDRIQKWTPGVAQGITVAGGNGSGSAANQLSFPYGVYVDSNGNIFGADANNNRIQKVQYQPQIVIPAGQTSGTVSFGAINDLKFEGNETVVLGMDIIANAIVSPTQQALNLTIIDDELPPNTIGGSRCGTGTVTLSATGCAGIYSWYASSTGGNSLGTGNSFTTPSISTTTTYYVDCTINDSKSLSRSAAIATINTTPPQPGAFTASSPAVCQGSSKTYSIASVADASGYLWSYSGTGASINGSATSVSLTYSISATSGVLSVKSVGSCGNSAERTMNVTVNSNPTATPSSNSPICAGTSLNLTGGGGTTYVWSGPNSFTSSAQSPNIASATGASSGVYTLTVTNASSCTSTATTSVTVNPALVIPTPQANAQINSGASLTLTATGCSGAYNVLKWYQASNNVAIIMPLTIRATNYYYAKCETTLNGITCTSGKSTDVTVVVSPSLITSIVTGNWEANTTWDVGRVPQLGDNVIVDNNHIVTLSTTGAAKSLQYRGTGQLKFNTNTSKLELGF